MLHFKCNLFFSLRIKFVLKNAEDFCPWNKIKSSKLCKASIFFRECTTCQKKCLLQNFRLQSLFSLSGVVLTKLQIDLLRINWK
jgi:hypothetical protein